MHQPSTPAPVFGSLCHAARTRTHSLLRFGIAFLAVLFSFASTLAQTIRVDITPDHIANKFVPNQALGAGIDRMPAAAIDKLSLRGADRVLRGGAGRHCKRQTRAAHRGVALESRGTWSDPAGKGYFTGSDAPTEIVRNSYGYPLPHRGATRNDGTDATGYGRITDGDENTYWKSNPYLTKEFTGEDDTLHPQWIVVDLANPLAINAIRIAWADPYAKHYRVQYWTGEQPIVHPDKGAWITFSGGT